MNISGLFNALQKGTEVLNAVQVKKAGVAVSLVSMALSSVVGYGAALGWFAGEVSPETIYGISSTLVTGAMAFLSWVQVATTKRIGFTPDDNP
jgi:hypothetical protein